MLLPVDADAMMLIRAIAACCWITGLYTCCWLSCYLQEALYYYAIRYAYDAMICYYIDDDARYAGAFVMRHA